MRNPAPSLSQVPLPKAPFCRATSEHLRDGPARAGVVHRVGRQPAKPALLAQARLSPLKTPSFGALHPSGNSLESPLTKNTPTSSRAFLEPFLRSCNPPAHSLAPSTDARYVYLVRKNCGGTALGCRKFVTLVPLPIRLAFEGSQPCGHAAMHNTPHRPSTEADLRQGHAMPHYQAVSRTVLFPVPHPLGSHSYPQIPVDTSAVRCFRNGMVKDDAECSKAASCHCHVRWVLLRYAQRCLGRCAADSSNAAHTWRVNRVLRSSEVLHQDRNGWRLMSPAVKYSSTCSLGHCELVFHLWVFWSYWRPKRDIEVRSDPCREVCGSVGPVLDERSRRRWAAPESLAIGYAGDAVDGGPPVWLGRRFARGAGTPTRDEAPHGPHSTPWRYGLALPHPDADQPLASRPRSKRSVGSAHARHPTVAAALGARREAGGALA